MMGQVMNYTSIFFLLMLCACQMEKPEEANSQHSKPITSPWKLICLGDDFTIATGLRPDEAYPAILAHQLKEDGHHAKVVNTSIKGETLQTAAERIEWILQQRFHAFLIALGSHDLLEGCTPKEWSERWTVLITKVRESHPDAMIIVGVPEGTSAQFVSILEEIGHKYDVSIVDFKVPIIDEQPAYWQKDNKQLSKEGQLYLAKQLRSVLPEEFQ